MVLAVEILGMVLVSIVVWGISGNCWLLVEIAETAFVDRRVMVEWVDMGVDSVIWLRFGIFVVIILLRFGIFVIIVKLEFLEHRFFVIEYVLVGNVLSPQFRLRGSSTCNIRVIDGRIMEQVDKSVIGRIECGFRRDILQWKWFGCGFGRNILGWNWFGVGFRRSILRWEGSGVEERCESVSDLGVSRRMWWNMGKILDKFLFQFFLRIFMKRTEVYHLLD